MAATWTSHNLPLTHKTSTIPGALTMSEEVRTQVLKKDLYHLFFQERGTLAGLRVLDLGCLEGGLSFEMAREDMDVLGVEGRASNYQKCQLIKRYYSLPNLNFVHLDVMNLNRQEHGVFDVILNCGILYHLADPLGFLHRMSSLTHDRTVLFLDTHFAPADTRSPRRRASSDGRSLPGGLPQPLLGAIGTRIRRALRKISRRLDGPSYRGQNRWTLPTRCPTSRPLNTTMKHSRAAGFKNGQTATQTATQTDDAEHPWSSISGADALWLTFPSLLRALYGAGFTNIYNLYGAFEINYEFALRQRHSRLYLFAVKDGFFRRHEPSPQPAIATDV